jgi:hypothetical protein
MLLDSKYTVQAKLEQLYVGAIIKLGRAYLPGLAGHKFKVINLKATVGGNIIIQPLDPNFDLLTDFEIRRLVLSSICRHLFIGIAADIELLDGIQEVPESLKIISYL